MGLGIPAVDINGMSVPLGDPSVITLLEQVLAAARTGKIRGVVIVTAVGLGNFQSHIAGQDFCTMHAGCAVTERQLEAMMCGAGSPQSRIARP